MSSIIDYTDRSTCVLFGDGAGAVVVGPASEEGFGILDFEHQVDGSGGPALCMPAGGSRQPASHETVDQRLHYVKQEGATVFKFAVNRTGEVCERLLSRNNLTRQRHRPLRVAPGEPPHHHVGRRAARAAGREGGDQHRTLRQYHRRHHSPRPQRRRQRRAASSAGIACCWRRSAPDSRWGPCWSAGDFPDVRSAVALPCRICVDLGHGDRMAARNPWYS